MNKINKFLSDNRQLLYLLCFLPLQVLYFISQRLPLRRIVIDLAVDRAIPFISVFIIPYILWYAYIPLMMLYMYFTERSRYLRQCVALFSGMAFCTLLFMVFPTALPQDFRPQNLGNGFFGFLCKMIYANDMPYNVCPSLHCFEAIVIHIMSFYGTLLSGDLLKRSLSAVLCVLICLSTLFVKQHSVIDVFVSTVLAVAIAIVVNTYCNKRRKLC